MKRNALTMAIVLLLGITWLLSGTLLVLHADHTCQDMTCPICTIIARSAESFLLAITILVTAGLLTDMSAGHCYGPPENRFVPEWTLVQRKVKLLN